jgi:hypothetical protein
LTHRKGAKNAKEYIWFFDINLLRELCAFAVKNDVYGRAQTEIMSTHETSMCIREMPLPVRDPG